MAEANWAYLTDGLAIDKVDNGPTAGSTKPNGGGIFVYGFHTLEIVDGAVARHNTQTNFAPTAKGGSIRGALMRGASAGKTGFAPFLFICAQGGSVDDEAYMLGLGDGDPSHVVLRKGALSEGLADEAVAPASGEHILMKSIATYGPDEWVHLRLDAVLQGSGDVLLQCYFSDLALNDIRTPDWQVIVGMEGPQAPTISGFVDDSLAVNTGSSPFAAGRMGFGFWSNDVARRAFVDGVEAIRQI